ncbi:hypothetical protein KD146_07490 [Devosia sp. BSSL-BM10]|uniref:O-antigen polysaccharide polymerase Wzy n=1 Tax=Devosia litorisediminis TaxID=2829817 RepID=A0A942I665_9HYPH|nr:hypothetical protein [Devosia litorisediminis]MBS3848543.1 hypothetical protein [Devosia litorisediminis]
MISVVILFISIGESYQGEYSNPILLISVCLILWLAALIRDVMSPSGRPVSTLVSIYMVSFFLVPGLLHLDQKRFPFFNANYSVPILEKSAMVVFLFSIFYLIGANVNFGQRGAVSRGENFLGYRPPRMPLLILLSAALAVTAGALFGFDRLHTTRGEFSHVFAELSATDLIQQSVARICGFLTFLYATINIRSRRNIASASVLLFSILVFLATNNILSLPRYIVAGYIISTVVVHFRLTPKSKALGVVVLMVGQITLFPILSELARGDIAAYFNRSQFDYLATSGDFDGFQSTTSVVQMVEGTGVKSGLQLLSALLFFVPRELFPEKSVGTGGEAAQYASFPFINLSAPIPSELYVDFGTWGLVVLSLVFGTAVQMLDRSYDRVANVPGHIARIVPALVAGFAIIVMRGSLVGVIGPLVMSVVYAHFAQHIVRDEGPYKGITR